MQRFRQCTSHNTKWFMKLFSFLLAVICLCTIQCKKNSSGGPVFTGKLIVNGPCDHYVIQLENGTIDTANIVAVWFDTDNDSVYNNVFTVTNMCSFGVNGLIQGDVFTFQLDPNMPAQYCPICAIAVATPQKQNAVVNVQKAN
jgi:hypothetical protein